MPLLKRVGIQDHVPGILSERVGLRRARRLLYDLALGGAGCAHAFERALPGVVPIRWGENGERRITFSIPVKQGTGWIGDKLDLGVLVPETVALHLVGRQLGEVAAIEACGEREILEVSREDDTTRVRIATRTVDVRSVGLSLDQRLTTPLRWLACGWRETFLEKRDQMDPNPLSILFGIAIFAVALFGAVMLPALILSDPLPRSQSAQMIMLTMLSVAGFGPMAAGTLLSLAIDLKRYRRPHAH